MAEDVSYGAMTVPVPVASPDDIRDCVVSRRFMVEQVKEKHGQSILAFRQIDHLTESLVNPATRTYETLLLLSRRITFCMFKEDVSRAFRRLPIKEQHLKFMVVFFMYQGIPWRAQHLTCPLAQWAASQHGTAFPHL